MHLLCSNTQISFRIKLQNASQCGGQDGCTDGGAEGHLVGRSGAECDGIAALGGAAGDLGVVGDTQHGVRGGCVTAGGVFNAALDVEAHKVWQRRERCRETDELNQWAWKTVHIYSSASNWWFYLIFLV